MLARVLDHARVGVYSDHLSADDLRSAHLGKVEDIAAAIAAEGPGARVCVLPEGPQTIPFLPAAAAL